MIECVWVILRAYLALVITGWALSGLLLFTAWFLTRRR